METEGRRRAARRAITVAALALVLQASAGETVPGVAREVRVGEVLPDMAMDGLNGRAARLSSFRGRPLIINVWASWCGPCRAETASLERLAWSETGQRVTIIGISTDDDRRAAQDWLKASNATLSHFIDHELALERLLGANRLPLTVLVDAQGRVVERIVGARQWDDEASLRLVERSFAGSARKPLR